MEPIHDFSQMRISSSLFCEVSPASVQELSDIVHIAALHEVPLRVRGNGHSLNGSTLPGSSELLIKTEGLAGMRYDGDRGVTVGSGLVLWKLERYLQDFGSSLPVINDGYPGPSVGGYVSAGGFGRGSAMFGGFWENVAELTVIDGMGTVQQISRGDPLFPWFFGSMGQLGIIAQARLDVVPRLDDGSPVYPEGLAAVRRLPLDQVRVQQAGYQDDVGRLCWFTLFVQEQSLNEALHELETLQRDHGDTLRYRPRYRYLVRHRNVVAPLVYPKKSSFYAVGAWGIREGPALLGDGYLWAFEADLMRLTLERGYRRYVQSEWPSGREVYEGYLGPDLYAEFRKRKEIQDPLSILNRGLVF